MASTEARTHDEIAEWLRATEAKVLLARAALDDRRRRVRASGHRYRASMEPLLAVQLANIEFAETHMARARAELGLAPLPATCIRTDGHGLSCELPFGHSGMHQASPDNVRRRWE